MFADGAMAELVAYATQVNYPVQAAFIPSADSRYNALYADWSEKQAEYEFFANKLRELRYNKFIAVEKEEPTLPQTQQSVLKSPLFRFVLGGMIVGVVLSCCMEFGSTGSLRSDFSDGMLW